MSVPIHFHMQIKSSTCTKEGKFVAQFYQANNQGIGQWNNNSFGI